MAYRPLRKLWYEEPEEAYEKHYLERFQSPEAIHLDFPVSGYSAFFLLSIDVTQLTNQILRLDKQLGQLISQLPGKALDQYTQKCLIDEAVLTNQIEGVHSTRKEMRDTLDVIEKQSFEKGKHHRFLGLVNKYNKLSRLDPIALETCEQIRELYDEIVLPEVLAEDKQNAPDGRLFRKDQATVRSKTDKVIHQGVTPESRIIELMTKALAFLNDEQIDGLYRLCLFHYLMEYIHPFYDGNGRLGRFIVSYCISQSMEPLIAYRISETIKDSIKQYYDAFETCNDPRNRGDLTPFLIMMLQMLRDAMVDLQDGLTRRITDWSRYELKVRSFYDLSDKKCGVLYSYLIQAALFSGEGISRAELLKLLEVSDGTLRKMLSGVDAGELLLKNRQGNKKYYKLNLERLDQLFAELKTKQ